MHVITSQNATVTCFYEKFGDDKALENYKLF